jgi:hypothetical protein
MTLLAAHPFRGPATMAGPRAIAVLLLTLLSAWASAAEPPEFLATSADGRCCRGHWQTLGPDWSIRLDGQERLLPGRDLVSLRRVDRPLPPMPEDLHLLLSNGDRLPVEGPRVAGERVFFRHPDLDDGKETHLPLAALAALARSAPTGAEYPEALRRRLIRERRSRDLLLLANGDRIEGVFKTLDGGQVGLEVSRRTQSFPLGQIAVLALSTELAETLRPRGVYAVVTLYGTEGMGATRLSLADAACTDGVTLTGTTLFGARLRVPLSRVAALDLMQGRAVYLSDLDPARYEYLPYLDERWPLVVDGSAAGRDLRLGASVYARGVGMHAHSRATWTVPAGSRRFEAVVGIDPRTGIRGTARVRLLADGKVLDLGADPELTAAGQPLVVNVDVSGVKELTLEVLCGRGGFVQAHVNWVDARLIR